MKSLFFLVLLWIAAPTHAQKFGDWTTTRQDYGSFSGTTNDSGNLFGYACYLESAKCIWVLTVADSCTAGSSYPVLVNANTGSSAVDLACVVIDGASYLTFTDFKAAADIVNGNTKVAIAYPVKNGSFVVLRFSLVGGTAGTAAAETIVINANKNSTRNQVL